MRRVTVRRLKIFSIVATIAALGSGVLGQSGGANDDDYGKDERMSSMGRAAARARHDAETAAAVAARAIEFTDKLDDDQCVNEPRCPAGIRDGGPSGGQAELTIAVDSTGQHVVIGFNDTRGFSLNPVSVSGFIYSDDGGHTFVDGGQLPTPGNETIGTTRYPQIFGDPELEYLGGCTFIYSSIMVKRFSATRAVQTMSVHRSSDCGHSWQGPFEVTAATNPNGQTNSTTGAPRDAADKEFMSVDPETGRVLMSWSNFTSARDASGQLVAPGGVEIATTFSDNILATPPTWSTRNVVAKAASDGQGSSPAYAAGSANAYVAWRRFPFPGTFFGFGNTVGFSRSTDNGQTWSASVELSPEFVTMDQVLGNDRVNTSPSVAVDNSGSAHAGNIYVVYSNNNSLDGADIVFQRSADLGLTFSGPLLLNSRPGADRAQWFPWVTVDSSSGRVHVFYYDQGIATSGDRTEVLHTYSDDGGQHWVAPLPLTRRPFNAGWGNDTGQPNLGDYNQAVAQNGELFAAWAEAAPPPFGFTDGQPSTSMTVPDVAFRRYAPTIDEGDGDGIKPTTLDLQAVTFSDSGGNGQLDPGETARFQFVLRNYVTNPLNASKVRGVHASLATTTPGVVIVQGNSNYSNIDPGLSVANRSDFVVLLTPGFAAGTPIEFRLDVRSADFGTATLLHRQFTGTPVPAVIFSENFNGAAAGTLPAGWAAVHGAGAVTVPWTTSNTFCGTTSNAAFHTNDNVGDTPPERSRYERLFSPSFVVPIAAQYVTIEFDVCYDSEEDPNFNILAYDGFFLRITDLTSGRTLRSVLVEAFADEFTTGSMLHYPRHFPRSSDRSYFEDMSAWSGFSNGFKRVRMRLPGMAGSTVQLRFEYTQDRFSTCEDVRGSGRTCGVMVDNIVVKSVTSQIP